MQIVGIKEIKKYVMIVVNEKGSQSEIPINDTAYLHLKHVGVPDVASVDKPSKPQAVSVPEVTAPEDWHLEMSKRFMSAPHAEEVLRSKVGFGTVSNVNPSDTDPMDPGEFTFVTDGDDEDEAQQL